MSKYEELQTVLSDPGYLLESLRLMGFEPEEHDQAVPLVGYGGDEREERAHIIIRRRQVGTASNDIGFVRDGNRYRAIISQYDSRKYNAAWLGKLSQTYKEVQTMDVARKKGYTFLGKRILADGKVQLKFALGR